MGTRIQLSLALSVLRTQAVDTTFAQAKGNILFCDKMGSQDQIVNLHLTGKVGLLTPIRQNERNQYSEQAWAGLTVTASKQD